MPIPEKQEASDYRELQVGNLRFELQKIHAHERGDLFVFLDKTIPENAAEGRGGRQDAPTRQRGRRDILCCTRTSTKCNVGTNSL